MKIGLFLILSFLVSSVGLSFDKSECRDCSKEVKDQVADIRKQFKISKKADVVVLRPGEEGAKELKEIVERDKIDNTDLVLVPIEDEPGKDGKKKTAGYVVAVKGISKHVGGVLGVFSGGLVGVMIGVKLVGMLKKNDIFTPSLMSLLAYEGGNLGSIIGKKFGKWVVQKLPQPKKKEEETPTPASSAPASN